jgi:hypothetical protein
MSGGDIVGIGRTAPGMRHVVGLNPGGGQTEYGFPGIQVVSIAIAHP